MPDDPRLPPLRQELRIERGTATANGQPSWTIVDPVRHAFFQIGQRDFELLSLWAEGTLGRLTAALRLRRRPLAEGEVAGLTEFLMKNGLTEAPPGNAVKAFSEQAAAKRQDWWQWLLKNYLFLRVPLVRPDAFLRRTVDRVAFVWSRPFLAAWAAITLVGVYLTVRQWDAFIASFPDFFNLRGLAIYGVALFIVKALHECGHAYAAVRFGARVPAMGVAIILLLPLLYTDTTGLWRVKSRRHRLIVDGAGVGMELLVAGVATFLWAFLPDGFLRSAAFVLATTGWLLSLAINLNPFMRFDGYYLLSDAAGVPNLQDRSFAFGKWWLREVLFGLGRPMPEPVGGRGAAWRIAYAYGTWLYRLFLFTTIALAVYAFFFKALGIILFAIEIWWFIARPIANEIRVWRQDRAEIWRGIKTRRTLAIAAGGLLLFILPLDRHVSIPAVHALAIDSALTVEEAGRIDLVAARDGAVVSRGDVLFRLSSPALATDIARAETDVALLDTRIARMAGDIEELSQIGVLERERQAASERLSGLRRRLERLTVRAPIDGQLRDVPSDLAPGRWMPPRTVLGRVVTAGQSDVRGLVAASDAERLTGGARGRFVSDDPLSPSVTVILSDLDIAASATVDPPLLASVNGGDIAAVRDDTGALRPQGVVYPARFTIPQSAQAPSSVRRGIVSMDAEARSPARLIATRIGQVLSAELNL
ncbi:MAG: hypothetical protein AAF205_07030 [Pseudomonadota bacterium]